MVVRVGDGVDSGSLLGFGLVASRGLPRRWYSDVACGERSGCHRTGYQPLWVGHGAPKWIRDFGAANGWLVLWPDVASLQQSIDQLSFYSIFY